MSPRADEPLTAVGGPREVVRRLLDAGLITPAQVVDGGVTVRNLSRSNSVFDVSVPGGEYVVKGSPLEGLTGRPRQQRERRLYTRAANDARLRGEAPFPEVVELLDDVLVMRRARPGETLDDRQRRHGRSEHDARMLGRALGAWRSIASGFADLELPGALPWVLRALGPAAPEVVTQNPGTERLAGLLRTDRVLRTGLEQLAREWRTESVIHGDVRLDNAVVDTDRATESERVVLVDWEFVDIGEAGWDVAGALADPLAQAAVDAGFAGKTEEFRPVEPGDAARLVAALTGWLEAFAAGYLAAAPAPAGAEDLEAGLKLVPARVLQIAFLHAAWGHEAGLGSALAVAGLASTLFGHPELLVHSLAADRAGQVERAAS